jgi:hypothetical protein
LLSRTALTKIAIGSTRKNDIRPLLIDLAAMVQIFLFAAIKNSLIVNTDKTIASYQRTLK